MVNQVPCPRYARTALERIEELAALEPPAHPDDVTETLEQLEPEDWVGRLISKPTGEPMYVSKPLTLFGLLYVKVVLRNDCVVVSFHEEVET